MIRSLTDWIADQVTAIAHPVTQRIAADIADRLTVDVAVTIHTGTKEQQ